MTVTQMEKKFLKEIAYEKIKEKIIRGDYTDNPYTSENELVRELNMSRTPIREALHKLEHEKLIKLTGNGVIIQELSIKDTNDILDLRVAIEVFSLRKSIHLVKQKDIDELQKIIDEQQVAVANEDSYAFMQGDIRFHQYLLEIGDNDLFLEIMKNLRERLFTHGNRIFNKKAGRMLKSLNEHKEIVEHLAAGNHPEAILTLERHIENGKLRLLT